MSMVLRRIHVIIWMGVKMRFNVLASGSKGNCTYILAGSTQLVIDCGGTKRYLLHCFHSMDVDLASIDALLITHDHIDHVAQLNLFKHVEKIIAPVSLLKREDAHILEPYQKFQIKDVGITPLVLSHDRAMTYGYVIEHFDEKLVYITDTGYLKANDYAWISNADYYIFESNHDVELLMRTSRPYPTKQRILSDEGHLSNEDSSMILAKVCGDKTKEIVLAHLSCEANEAELAKACVIEAFIKEGKDLQTIKLCCAKQFEMIEGGINDEEVLNIQHHLAFAHLE